MILIEFSLLINSSQREEVAREGCRAERDKAERELEGQRTEAP